MLDVLDGVLDPVYFGIHFLRFHAARQTGPSPRLGEPVAVFEAGTATLDITDVTVICVVRAVRMSRLIQCVSSTWSCQLESQLNSQHAS